jgi:hypothetical protein
MTIKVELFVESTASDDVLVLDDATKGKLDDATYPLGGGPGADGLPKDITSFAHEVSVQRGRTREDETINAGSCVVALRNGGRDFDPQFSADAPVPATYGPIGPGKRVRISDGSVVVFDGAIDDWDYRWYVGAQYSDASLTALDVLASLAVEEFDQFVAPVELPASRINRVLDASTVDFPVLQRDLDDGVTPLAAATVDADRALGTIQDVALSDVGRLFASRDNKLTFRSRDRLATTSIVARFDDTATNIPFHEIDVLFGSEQLSTVVSVTREGGGTFTAVADDDIIAEYGHRALSRTVLSETDEFAQQLASFLLRKYQQPLAVIQRFGVVLDDLESADRAVVAGLEIGDVVEVTWTPTGAGTQVVQELVVEGVDFSETVGQSAFMAFRLSNVEGRFAFLLDSSLRGVLDADTLGL